eukprot:GHVT01002764.1.p1 GENE.GHVT01002764.1~~GHVT01002764.1.p1  ORF type:complete len:866 (-),score=210.48 GHVT01002764.1:2428-5025(-)
MLQLEDAVHATLHEKQRLQPNPTPYEKTDGAVLNLLRGYAYPSSTSLPPANTPPAPKIKSRYLSSLQMEVITDVPAGLSIEELEALAASQPCIHAAHRDSNKYAVDFDSPSAGSSGVAEAVPFPPVSPVEPARRVSPPPGPGPPHAIFQSRKAEETPGALTGQAAVAPPPLATPATAAAPTLWVERPPSQRSASASQSVGPLPNRATLQGFATLASPDAAGETLAPSAGSLPTGLGASSELLLAADRKRTNVCSLDAGLPGCARANSSFRSSEPPSAAAAAAATVAAGDTRDAAADSEALRTPAAAIAARPTAAIAAGRAEDAADDVEGVEGINDPLYVDQWNLRASPPVGIAAAQTWRQWSGATQTPMVIAVIDSGCDTTHPELQDALWTNPGEICGDGIDNDGNGYVDDCHGWNFVDDNNDLSPSSSSGHGTGAFGILAAGANNNVGIVGTCWGCKVMCLKFIGGGRGRVSDQVAALEYALKMGAWVSNNSYGGYGFSAPEYEAISRAQAAGHLFVTSAGNHGLSTDLAQNDHTPSCYPLDNIVSVGATTQLGQRAAFSNYGRQTVHVMAPGNDVITTKKDAKFAPVSGTSFASPHVAAAAALVWSAYPQLTYSDVKHALIDGCTYIENLEQFSACAGQLNMFNALVTAARIEEGTYVPQKEATARSSEDILFNHPHANTLTPKVKLEGNNALEAVVTEVAEAVKTPEANSRPGEWGGISARDANAMAGRPPPLLVSSLYSSPPAHALPAAHVYTGPLVNVHNAVEPGPRASSPRIKVHLRPAVAKAVAVGKKLPVQAPEVNVERAQDAELSAPFRWAGPQMAAVYALAHDLLRPLAQQLPQNALWLPLPQQAERRLRANAKR